MDVFYRKRVTLTCVWNGEGKRRLIGGTAMELYHPSVMLVSLFLNNALCRAVLFRNVNVISPIPYSALLLSSRTIMPLGEDS